MITGSHHQQIYWYATGHDRALNVLPGVYLIADDRWAPRSAVVLHPPNQAVSTVDGHWNAVCLACHTTFPRTRFDTPFLSEAITEQAVDTTTTEFGIACEACHGPAAEHVRRHRNPLRRYASHLGDGPDPTIVLPTRLDPQRSSQVCGQCHSVWEFQDAAGERRANAQGFPYRPGDELRDTRFLPQPTVQRRSAELAAFVARDPAFVTGSFWPDGLIRVSGREYNGLIDSPCYKGRGRSGTHAVVLRVPHDAQDAGRPAAGRRVGPTRTRCRRAWTATPPARSATRPWPTTWRRTRAIRPDSAGSTCYNCHMPYTSYGLLKAIRSHTVGSPSVAETVAAGRPNACNLCHLDRTLAWTGEALQDWYDLPSPPLTEDERTVAAGLLWAMRGDAGERALTAWALGWAPAQEASGTSWMVPHLAELLNDPYEAVRYIAYRSLRTLPGYAGVEYDYVASREERVAAALPILQGWQNSALSRRRREPELLVDADGRLRIDEFRRILHQRDNRPLFLRE